MGPPLVVRGRLPALIAETVMLNLFQPPATNRSAGGELVLKQVQADNEAVGRRDPPAATPVAAAQRLAPSDCESSFNSKLTFCVHISHG
jgi:hypothetical protein